MTEVFSEAHATVGTTPVMDAASLSAKLVERMRSGLALFSYRKKDGSLRTAYGTLNVSIIPTTSYTVDKLDGIMAKVEQLERTHAAGEDTFTVLEELKAARSGFTIDAAERRAKASRENVGNVTYYDLEAGAWRQFVIENLNSVVIP